MIQEQTYADTLSVQGYLYEWARRTGNMENLENYYVEALEDSGTGRPIFRVRDVADLATNPSTDAAGPAVIDLTPESAA